MIIFRYLSREVLVTLSAVSAVLLVIIMSGRFIKYLAQAAQGLLDPGVLFLIMGYRLPGFLERLRDRLGDGCQPGKHQPRPRNERDETHASTPVRRGRRQRYRDDVDRAGELAAVATQPDDTKPAHNDLHERW